MATIPAPVTFDQIKSLFDAQDQKFSAKFEDFSAKFQDLENKFETRFFSLETRFEGLETRFSGLETRFEDRFTNVETKLVAHSKMLSLIADAVADLHVKFARMESKMDAMASDIRLLRAVTEINTWDIAVIRADLKGIRTDARMSSIESRPT